MTAPHSLAHLARNKGNDTARRIRALEQAVAQLTTARTLEAASIGKGGITVNGGSIWVKDAGGNVIDTIDANGLAVTGGSVTISGGSLVIAGTGAAQSANFVHNVSGYKLNSAGNAEFNTLTLRGGIIGNDALTSPVVPAAGDDANSGYAIPLGNGNTGGGTTRGSVTFTVPAGFTRAIVTAISMDYGVNSTGAEDYLTSYVQIGGTYNYASSATVPAGKSGAATAAVSKLVTGLTGGSTFTVQSRPFAVFAGWATNSVNSLALSASVLFLR